jgi:hypothetical protein
VERQADTSDLRDNAGLGTTSERQNNHPRL